MHLTAPSATILALAATSLEMGPFLARTAGRHPSLVTGVGPAETTFRLCRYLEQNKEPLAGVLLFGTGGAYAHAGPGMLDVCVATSEIFGDVGRCRGDEVELFHDPLLTGPTVFHLDGPFARHAMEACEEEGAAVYAGPFVTVSCASASRTRGDLLRKAHDAIVENMEGAAAARVCLEYALPFAELRVVSNMVDGSPKTAWRLEDACARAARLAAVCIERLVRHS